MDRANNYRRRHNNFFGVPGALLFNSYDVWASPGRGLQ